MSFVNSIITTQGLRHQNRAIVLNSIREYGPLAHTDIGIKTSLASGTVSVVTTEFLEEGVLKKIEQAPAKGRGRPRILFATRSEFAHIVLVRVFANFLEFSLVDYSSTLLDRQLINRDLSQADMAVFAEAFKSQLKNFVARTDKTPDDIKVISITTKGEIDEATCTLVWSAIFGNQRINFRDLLSSDWPATVTLTNENCFFSHNVMQNALRNDDAKAGDRHAVLSLSDNVGLGVATLSDDGEIELFSPSFGHMPHIADGPLCRCGSHGCLESYAGFYGIIRTAFDAPTDNIPAKFIPLEQIRRVAETARQGDRKTIFAFRQAGTALGMCLSRMFNVLGPMPLTIVGAGLEFYDLFKDGLEQKLNENFLVRGGHRPNVTLYSNESEPTFESNVFVSLRRYDRTKVATRRHKMGR